jgi:PAS domain S-box-containing protein
MRRSEWPVAAFLAISSGVASPRMTEEDNKVRPSEAPHPVQAESQQACDARIYPLADSLLTAAKRILEMIPAGASLTDILTNLCTAIDDHNPDMMSIVMLMDADGQRLWPAAAPRMPSDFVKAISPLMIGENMASCGTAAFRRERVILPDVATDPLMSGLPAGLRELVLAQGLRAQWSQPLFSKHNDVLGTFGLFHGTPRSPTDRQLQLIEDAATIAVIAIEGERSRAALKQAFLDIQTSEQELRSIVDAIPHTIVVLGPDGSPLYANRAVLDYTGLTIEEVMAPDSRLRMFHPDDVARLQDERRQALARGVPFENEQRARRKDGEYRWFLVRYHPLRDEQGRLIRWYATGTDIDDRKRAEERMRNETLALREDIDRASMFEEIVGSSAALQRVLEQVAKVAKTDSTVLILGETGTGKELIARAIHKRSPRANRAFIRVNCAAIPPSLIASELFGHEKGAFTGAVQRRLGRFEAADGGTIFLDEIGDLPAETQIALLRVLQEREIERVGSSQPLNVDVRVLAATNRDLEAAVERGAFREDLYYRLNVFPIWIPPLRERGDDIPVLVEYLVERYGKKAGKTIRNIRKQTLELFQAYDWPGNVRELQNVIERAVVLCEGETFAIDESWLRGKAHHLSERTASPATTLADGERGVIEAALAACHGRISGPKGAATRLGIPRQTLESKIKALRIDTLAFRAR